MKAAFVLMMAGLVVVVGACSRREAPAVPGPSAPPQGDGGGEASGSGGAAEQGFAQIYTTRGVVRALPDPSNPASEFQIQHEEIPEFVNGQGETVGMRTMTMPFPTLADGVSLEGLAVGDKITFTFGVVWVQGASRPYPRWTVTAIEKLPPEAELELGGAPGQSPEAGG